MALDKKGNGPVQLDHPGGGRSVRESYFDEHVGRPYVQWGLAGSYEVALTPKKFGQLIGGAGWQVDVAAADQWAKLHEAWKRQQKKLKK